MERDQVKKINHVKRLQKTHEMTTRFMYQEDVNTLVYLHATKTLKSTDHIRHLKNLLSMHFTTGL